MATSDTYNVFERIYNGMSTLCSEGTLSERLKSVLLTIAPLRAEEFPETMRADFTMIAQGIRAARDSKTNNGPWEDLAKKYLELYTKVARLNGTR
jgi:hypothetical protein